MTPEEKELLVKTYKLVEENNTLLKSLRRTQRLGTFMKSFYWILIIGLSVVGYWGAQTYIKSITNAISGNGDTLNSSSLIDQYRELLK